MTLALMRMHLGSKLPFLVFTPIALLIIGMPLVLSGVMVEWAPALPLAAGALLLAGGASVVSIVLPLQPSPFELRLPVPVRQVLQARMLTAGVYTSVPLMLWVLSLPMQESAFLPPGVVLGVAPYVAMALMLSYFAPATPRLWRGASLTWEVRLRLVLLTAVTLGVCILLPAIAALLLLSMGTVALFALLRRSVPASIPLSTATPAAANSTPDAHGVQQSFHIRRWWTRRKDIEASTGPQLVRKLLKPSLSLGEQNMPFFLGVGATVPELAMFMALAVGLIVLSAMSPASSRSELRWLVALPVSHRQRLWLSVGPTLMVVLAGFVTGVFINIIAFPSSNTITRSGQETDSPGEWYSSPTQVSLSYWQRAPLHTQPQISAPWGESVLADTLTLFGVTRFNPYTARKESGTAFVDWQFRRASAVVIGREYALAAYEALPERARPRPMLMSWRAIAYTLCLLATGLLLLYWLSELHRWHRLRHKDAVGWIGMLLVFAALGLMTAGLVMSVGYDVELALWGLESLVQYALRWLPDSLPLTLLITIVPPLAVYRLLEWQFARSEMSADELAVAKGQRVTR